MGNSAEKQSTWERCGITRRKRRGVRAERDKVTLRNRLVRKRWEEKERMKEKTSKTMSLRGAEDS